MKGREIVDFITREGLLNEDLFLTDVYGNTYGYMTVEEYAADIGTGTAVVKTMIKRGDLDYVIVQGQTLIPAHKWTNENVSGMNDPTQSCIIVNVPNVRYGTNLIEGLKSAIAQFGYVSIADLRDMMGCRNRHRYIDNSYGWTAFDDSLEIKLVGQGLVIHLPNPIKLEV